MFLHYLMNYCKYPEIEITKVLKCFSRSSEQIQRPHRATHNLQDVRTLSTFFI